MNLDEDNLIWLDLEMTGLDSFRDQIIEIATIVTDSELEVLAEGPAIAAKPGRVTLRRRPEGWDEETAFWSA